MRKLRKGNYNQIDIAKIFDYDIVLVPFFFEEPERGANRTSSYKSTDTQETPTPGEYDGSATVLVAIHTNTLN